MVADNETLNFLVEATTLLSESLDYETTLGRLAHLAVPRMADWCAIDIQEPAGGVRRLAVAHVDPAKVALAHEIMRLAPYDPAATAGLAQVLRSGQPEMVPAITDDMVRQGVADPELRDLLLRLGLRSSMIVPLKAHGRTLGAIQLVTAESQREFTATDLRLAEDLARRAGVAIDNARLYEQLLASEQRYRALADSMPLMVWLADPNGDVTYVNRRWVEFTDVKIGADGRLERRDMLHPDDRELTMHRWRECVARGEPYEVEYRVQRHDGAYRWQLVRAVPVANADGAIDYWVGTNTDIDDQKQHEAALRERTEQLALATAALRERNRELDQFAYITSHDLRAPLRGIANLAGWIEEDLGEAISPDTRSYLELMGGRVRRMEDLIGGILRYSRVGRSGGAVEEVPVNDLLCEVIDLLAPAGQVNIAVAPNMPTLHTERLLLHQVFSNLIGNAIKQLEGGGD
jgi:PAS domain S-box-containing protein